MSTFETFEDARTVATSEEAQAAKDGDTEMLVRLAATAGCTAMTKGAGAQYCSFVFGGGFEKAIQWVAEATPSSWRAQGTACYPCQVGRYLSQEDMWSGSGGTLDFPGILPSAQRYVDAGIKGLNESYHRGRQALGLTPKPFDAWTHMRAWLYAEPGARWNSAPIVQSSNGKRRIELVPSEGPWAISWRAWPDRPGDCGDGCEQLFAARLTGLYTLRLRDFDVCRRQMEKDIAAGLTRDASLLGTKRNLLLRLMPSNTVQSSVLSQLRRADPFIPAGMLARFAKGPAWLTPFYGPGHFTRLCVGAGIAAVVTAALLAKERFTR